MVMAQQPPPPPQKKKKKMDPITEFLVPGVIWLLG